MGNTRARDTLWPIPGMEKELISSSSQSSRPHYCYEVDKVRSDCSRDGCPGSLQYDLLIQPTYIKVSIDSQISEVVGC